MRYYIFSQGIETDKIKAVFGSNNENILELIKKTEIFQYYGEKFKTTLKIALEDIIRNRSYDEKSNFAYGYAIICISATLGKNLPYTQEIKLGYETDLIDKYLNENFQVTDFIIDDILFEEMPPFDISSIDDWPIIGVCNTNKLKELQNMLKDVKITDEEIELLERNAEDEDKAFAYMHLKGLKDNIKYCIKNNLDMINFCH